ncbi:MAG: hypothetical protein MMC33_010543 [Icmadophila ericetorum]|nr:hypothetical protein [Icmadophila ericetorum]
MSTTNHFTSSWHTQDPRWTAVDTYTLSHLHPSTHPTSAALNFALENSNKNGLPDISTPPTFGKFLALQTIFGKVQNFLEVGTLGGYSCIWIALLNPAIHITTVEVNPHNFKVAQENIEHAGVAGRVEVILGGGLDVLQQLRSEVDAGTRPRFGMTFIDADKLNNWNYFDLAVSMSLQGAQVYVDNVVFGGTLVDEKYQDGDGVIGARKVIEEAGKDGRMEACVVQIVGEKAWDGWLVGVVL